MKSVKETKTTDSPSNRTLEHERETLPYSPSKIRHARNKLNVTQFAFAQMLNVSTNTVNKWEQGERTPSLWSARLIASINKNPQTVLRPDKVL